MSWVLLEKLKMDISIIMALFFGLVGIAGYSYS